MGDSNILEIRQSLNEIRASWGYNSPGKPFTPSHTLQNGQTVSAYAFEFVFRHHVKRHLKGKKCKSKLSAKH